MANKAILKNGSKYNVLKVAKGIWLGLVGTKFRVGENDGISINNQYKNIWFNTPKGLGIFKSYDGDGAYIDSKNMRIVSEILCCELAKQIDVETAVYEPAHVDFKKGVITYNVCKKNEKLQNCFTFFDSEAKCSIQSIIKGLDARKTNYDKQKMFFDLYKMMVFDALTFQEDRHNNNIHFIINEQDNSLRLSPLIDNEFAFATKTIDEFCNDWNSPILYLKKEKFIAYHGHNIIFFIQQEDYSVPASKRYENNVKNLVVLAQKNHKCKEFLHNALEKFDILAAIEKLQKYGYQLSDDYKNYLIDLTNLSKEIFKENIQTLELENKEKVEVEINER